MGLPITTRRAQRRFDRAYKSHKRKRIMIAQRRQAEFANAVFNQFAQSVAQANLETPTGKEKLN